MLTQIWSATDIIFCHFRPFFALLPHYWPQKLKFGKNVENTCNYHPFTHMNHKPRSYIAWFLRYKVQKTKFFVIMGHFLPFDSPDKWKNQNFEKIKKLLEILSFYTGVPQMTTISCMIPEISSVRDIFFCHFELFFGPFTTPHPTPNKPENLNFEKIKKTPVDILFYTLVP